MKVSDKSYEQNTMKKDRFAKNKECIVDLKRNTSPISYSEQISLKGTRVEQQVGTQVT